MFTSATLLALLCMGSPLISGQPIPVGTPNGSGPLSADKIFNHPVGAAHALSGTEPDLFVIAGSRFHPELVLLPFVRRDDAGVPVFGQPAVVATPEYMNYSTPGTILEFEHAAHALWVDKQDLVHLRFEREAMRFAEAERVVLPALPRAPACIGWLPDADGDGFTLLLGISDGVSGAPNLPGVGSRDEAYDPYDGKGVWRGGFPYASLYSVRFAGLLTGAADTATLAAATDREVRNTYERITRVDLGDGRARDVVAGSLYGPLYYYHQDGTGGFEAHRNLAAEDGIVLRHPTIGPAPAVYPAAGGRWSDLLTGGEGAIYYYRFLDRFSESGQPIYADPLPALQEKAALYSGTLPVVNVADWDGDGRQDIVLGNSEGRVLFFRNAGSDAEPAFEIGAPVEAGGEPIHWQAGYDGSIQGPTEARWGYLCPTVVDWNGDGLLDIVTSGVTAQHMVYLNEGSATAPRLASPRMIYLDGLELNGTWRCQPGVAKIEGRMAYVALDDQDEFHLYWQIDAQNVSDGGKLHLDSGEDISANFLHAGGTGRIKIVLHDWDEDGAMDLIVGTPRHASIPDPETGLPQSLGLPGSAVMWLRNTGSNAAPAFARPLVFAFRGQQMFFGQHACSPAIAPFHNGGKPGLIVGVEIGRLLYFAREDISFIEGVPVSKSK